MHHLFWGHCVKSEVIVLDRGIFLREHSSRRKIPRPKTNTDEFTKWPKQRWCKVIIVINNRYLDILKCILGVIYETNTSLNLCLTQCLSIPVREFRSVQTWRSSRNVINVHVRGVVLALVWRFKGKMHFGLMTSHMRVIMRSHCYVMTPVATCVK